VAEMKTRVSARALKDTQRRKNALEASTLPTKLVDCRSKETEGSELFIVEGDSALGTAKLARDSEHQALLPIRGKILNTQKASVQDMLDNAECAAIIQVVGAGSGRTFDVSQARYGKIIIMSDADVDGAHIRTLLLTLFSDICGHWLTQVAFMQRYLLSIASLSMPEAERPQKSFTPIQRTS